MDFPRHFNRVGRPSPVEVLPERGSLVYKDFSRGLFLASHPGQVPDGFTPRAINIEVTDANRLRLAPGTSLVEAFTERQPSRVVVHGSLEFTAELVFFDPPYLGVRRAANAEWADKQLANSSLGFPHTNFGGTLIFSDGHKVYAREPNSGTALMQLDDVPVSYAYAVWAGRLWGGMPIIDGRFEPMGLVWSAANSDYRDFSGLGSGFELLINEINAGDRVISLRPMGLDFMVVLLRSSIWVGRRSGQVDSPGEFRVRETGTGAFSDATTRTTKYGVVYLADDGVSLFDGNVSSVRSKPINSELLPLDYDNASGYSANYDPATKRYFLHTPQGITWVYEMEWDRWYKRSLPAIGSIAIPDQTAFQRWADLVGDWSDQDPMSWFDYAGTSVGKADVIYLGTQLGGARAIAIEDYSSASYWGTGFDGSIDMRPQEGTLTNYLQTLKQVNIEHTGTGAIQLWAPNKDGSYEQVVSDLLADQSELTIVEIPTAKTGRFASVRLVVVSGSIEVAQLQLLTQRRGPRIPSADLSGRVYS